MNREETTRFAEGERAWRAGLGKVRDTVRQQLVARQLARHLPRPAPGSPAPRVLDVGCGQGTQAIVLARRGYDVTGVDPSEELLTAARAAASDEIDEVADRLFFEPGDLLDISSRYRERFDVACCHGVLMYLPSLVEGITAVVGAVRPGGLVSVLTRNRAAIAMRAGMTGDFDAALAGFDARYYRNRLGIDEVRADDPDEVAAALAAAGAERLEWYGVRLFCDHWETSDAGERLTALVDAEEEAGLREPYRRLCSLTHTIALRTELSQPGGGVG